MTIEQQFEKQHYADVPVDVTSGDVVAAFDAFDAFVSLPLEYRRAGDYVIPTKTTGDFGYRRRVAGHNQQGRDVSTDTKHVYHFGSQTRQVFEAHGWQGMPAEIKTFCEITEHLYWVGVAALRQTVAQLREEQSTVRWNAPDLWPLFFDPLHFPDLHLRLNGYEQPSSDTAYLGARHLDRSDLTVGVISSPGLEIGLSEDGSDAQAIPPVIGRAPVFAGGGWKKVPRQYLEAYPFIEPAVHGARQTDADYVSQTGKIVGHSAVLLANFWGVATDIPFNETKPQASSEPDMVLAPSAA